MRKRNMINIQDSSSQHYKYITNESKCTESPRLLFGFYPGPVVHPDRTIKPPRARLTSQRFLRQFKLLVLCLTTCTRLTSRFCRLFVKPYTSRTAVTSQNLSAVTVSSPSPVVLYRTAAIYLSVCSRCHFSRCCRAVQFKL